MSEKKVPGMSFSFGLPGGMAQQLFTIGCGGFDPQCGWLGSYGADAADATHASNVRASSTQPDLDNLIAGESSPKWPACHVHHM